MPISVKSILDSKGRAVVTVSADTTLMEAAAILAENRIGALVIGAVGGEVSGIFTERDVVKAVAKYGRQCLDQAVGDIMSFNIVRCSENSTVDEVMEMMTQRRFRHVPVEDDGKLSGIISIGDVVKAHIREIELEAEQIKAYIAG
ncbi:CBS domain-containing protein [Rhizobium sp. HT1-10]|uniref:CBS domain-containing protein n=1 Tax=Rhizobium sp. HT1-10 TaxID=3111638 RepID=UPI003C171239